MTSQLSEKARCKRCKREFEIDARYPGLRSRPMLVVLSEVASVQEALANAQCQDCLALGGPANKGLELVLKGLSAPATSSAPARVASADESDGNDPDVQRAILNSLLGTSGGSRLHVRDLEPKQVEEDPKHMSRGEVRKSLASQPQIPAGTTLDEGAISALEQAREDVRERELQRKRTRFAQFGGLMGSLKRRLIKIRELANVQRVDDLIDDFYAKLTEAIPLDPKRRGRKKLLAYLGTSHAELTELCVMCYRHLTVVPSEGDNGMSGVQGSLRTGLDPRGGQPLHKTMKNVSSMDMEPFFGGNRPEHWGPKGAGRQATFTMVSVVGGSRFPEPNPPREQYAGPKIVYAADRTFIRFADDALAFDQKVKGHGTVKLCAKGMFAIMEKLECGWVYHPCLPAEPGADLKTLMFVRLALGRVDSRLIHWRKHEQLLAEQESSRQEQAALAAKVAEHLIACVQVSQQGEQELPHEIQIAIGEYIGAYDSEPADQQVVYADPVANELTEARRQQMQDDSVSFPAQTEDGSQPSA